MAALGAGIIVYAQQPPPPRSQGAQQQAPAKQQTPAKPAPAAERKANDSPARQTAATSDAGPTTVFKAHARQGNITTCANVFDTLGRGVAADSTYTAQTQWDGKAGNIHSVQSLVAMSGGAGNPGARAVGVVFAAPIGQSCEGTLVRVTPMADACEAVAAGLLKINGQKSALGELDVVNLPNGAQVMLVPLGGSCVAVTAMRAASTG